ncbi:rhodanese-like domain-containing protein [bacterium]|nr:rhodanese-like domain-containing protein [bacterium]
MKPFESAEPQDWKKHCELKNGKIIDVRTADEFSDSYIQGAENIDIMHPDFVENVKNLDKNQAYFVYCRSGARSANAMSVMQELGFKEVYNLNGGIMQWEFSGNEVEYGDDF